MILERLKIFEKERELESYIPFSSLVTDHVVMERDGCLIATMKLNGIPFETQSPEDLLPVERVLPDIGPPGSCHSNTPG